MAPVQEIIEKFGGVTALSRKLGVPQTTVSGWNVNGVIPRWRHEHLLKLAETLGIDLTANDLSNHEREHDG